MILVGDSAKCTVHTSPGAYLSHSPPKYSLLLAGLDNCNGGPCQKEANREPPPPLPTGTTSFEAVSP